MIGSSVEGIVVPEIGRGLHPGVLQDVVIDFIERGVFEQAIDCLRHIGVVLNGYCQVVNLQCFFIIGSISGKQSEFSG